MLIFCTFSRKVAFLDIGNSLTGVNVGHENNAMLAGIHAIEYDTEEPNFIYK